MVWELLLAPLKGPLMQGCSRPRNIAGPEATTYEEVLLVLQPQLTWRHYLELQSSAIGNPKVFECADQDDVGLMIGDIIAMRIHLYIVVGLIHDRDS